MEEKRGPNKSDSSESTKSSNTYKDSTLSVDIKRPEWGSQLQFIFTSVGYVVGLGNIWRFPAQAYENGGGAFLIPYIICSVLIALPIVYLEMTLGQYTNSGPALAFGLIRPIFQGIGWGMVGVSALVSLYFNMVLGWAIIYLYMICIGQSYKWMGCQNEWNTENCSSVILDKEICNSTANAPIKWFNGTCHPSNNFTVPVMIGASEEFFERYVLDKSEGIDVMGGLNWRLVFVLFIAWVAAGAAILWGVKIMGRLSYVTGTLPYAIIAILVIRGVTLEGAGQGLAFYLTDMDLTAVYNPKTWANAVVQLCFSNAIGFGGIISLSSFNPKKHKSFRDAIIVCVADSSMSFFGGIAVFSILGFMAHELKKEVSEVVKSGIGLIFIAYPEALAQMPIPVLWQLLFFLMVFLLGISSQFGLAETVCTAIYDQFPHTRPYRPFITIGVCTVFYGIGLLLCTRAGIYYLSLLNEYASGYPTCVLAIMELLLIAYIYGADRYIEDLRSMFGRPRNCFSRFFGPTGYFLQLTWCVITPLLLFIITLILFKQQVHAELRYNTYVFPDWTHTVGWIISFTPFFMMLIPIFYDVYKYRKYKRNWREMFRLQHKWPSYYEHHDLGWEGSPIEDLPRLTMTSESSGNGSEEEGDGGKRSGASDQMKTGREATKTD